MFFQWVLCIAIWTTGLILNIFRNCPQLYPLGMLGGFFWTSGASKQYYILKHILFKEILYSNL